MAGLVIALVCALLFVGALTGLRLMRTTGLEDVEEFRPPTRERRPGFASMLDSLGTRLIGTTMRAYGPVRLRRLEESIRRAGRPDGLTLMVYVQRQGAFVFVSLVILLIFVMIGQAMVGLVFAVVLCGWMPLWLRTASRRRAAALEADLPDFLDVLGVTVKAGLSFRQAVERVCEVSQGPLADEMITVMREMSMGASRRRAFLAMRDRTRSEGVASFVTALLQAEELGVPLADAMEDIASDARREHAEQVRQAMAKVGPKASMVITTTIVPGAVVLIAAAMILGNGGILSGIL